jgi:hypothetical protein
MCGQWREGNEYGLVKLFSHIRSRTECAIVYIVEPFAAKKLLADLVTKLDISVLTTDRSILMKTMMR